MILEYQGNGFEQREEDNYVNLTEMAKPFGKFVKDWKKTEQSKAYLEAVSSVVRIVPSQLLAAA